MVRYLDISFPLTSVEKNVISVPFKVIYQTANKSLELKIAEKYPDLIIHASYNAEQLKRLMQMKSEIKNGLTSGDIDDIHNIFYEKYFLDPFVKSDKISEIKLTGFDCKVWTDNEAPYLEINGVISSDVDEIFQKLLQKRKLIIKKDFKTFKQQIVLKLISHLPLMYIFDKPTFLFSHFFHEIFMRQIDKHGTFWNRKIASAFRLKNFEKAKKEMDFSFNQITIKILDWGENIANKISQNKLETGMIGLMILGHLRNKKMYGEAVEGGKTAVVTYGRFNPVTRGHEKVFTLVNTLAQKSGGDAIVFSSPSEGDSKNPLKFTTKIKLLKEMVPRYAKSFSNKKFLTFVELLSYVYQMGYKNIIIVVGSDRIKSIKSVTENYNGVRGKRHGYYKFNTIKVASSGKRDDDTISGTQMREWALKNKIKEFKNGLPSGASIQQAKYIMNMIREGSE